VLEEGAAVDGFDVEPDGAVLAQHFHRDVDAGRAARPDLAIEIG